MQPIQKILTAGSILLAGTALTTVPAAAQPGAGGPSALGNVYSTNDWGDLSVTEWEAESFRAGYTFERGKIEGVRKGNEIDGFWTQATSDRTCTTPRDGSYHYGRMTFTFNPALDSFEGRWGYCDETPYATWNGTLTRRGTPANTAAKKPARRAAGSATAAAAADPVATPQAGAEQAYVYATIGFDKIKPELILDTRAATVTGTYTATQSEAELDAIYRTGTYGITSGTLEGAFSGNTLTGYWYETAYNAGLQSACDTERKGTRVFGRFVLTFSADRKSFTGLRTGCEIVPDAYEHSYNTWNGTLVRRQAAAPSVAAAASAQAPTAASPVGSSATPGVKPASRIIGRAARAAEDEVNAKAEDEARKAARGILDRLF
jgi:hypothetical protein